MFVLVGHYRMLEKRARAADIKTELNKTEKTTENPLTPMDTTLLLVVLSTIGILAGVIYNPKMIKLERKLDGYQAENRTQHDEIKESIKYLKMKHDLEISLREIVNGVIEITSGELSTFLDFEGNLFIDMVQEMIAGPLNVTALPMLHVKLDQAQLESRKRALELGEEFAKLHSISQQKFVAEMTHDIEETMKDEVFNTKYKRISMICERALHTHLTDSVRGYMQVKRQL